MSTEPPEQRSPTEDPVAGEDEQAPAAPATGRKTTRERADEKRQEKIDLVRQQVESGSLVIRPMTEEERLRYPPRPAPAKQQRRWK